MSEQRGYLEGDDRLELSPRYEPEVTDEDLDLLEEIKRLRSLVQQREQERDALHGTWKATEAELAEEREIVVGLREALWQYREYFGHDLKLHDEGRPGCPGCLAEKVLGGVGK